MLLLMVAQCANGLEWHQLYHYLPDYPDGEKGRHCQRARAIARRFVSIVRRLFVLVADYLVTGPISRVLLS